MEYGGGLSRTRPAPGQQAEPGRPGPAPDVEVIRPAVQEVSAVASQPFPKASVATAVYVTQFPATVTTSCGEIVRLAGSPWVTVMPVVAITGPPTSAIVPVTGKSTPAVVAENTLLPGGMPRNAFALEVVKVTSLVAVQLLP